MSATLFPVNLEKVQSDRLLPFNMRRIDEHYFISNGLGEWAILSSEQFQSFAEGTLPTDDALFRELAEKGFVAGAITNDDYRDKYWSWREHAMHGPNLHHFVLTERCDHGCQYCHSSIVGMDRSDTDMSAETAGKFVDFAMQTTSPALCIEFQGGEPLVNWDVLTHIVEYGRACAAEAQKELSFALVTNFTFMTEERLDYLIENRVQICTSIDGPEDIHNKVRRTKDGNSWQNATHWLKRVNERYVEAGLDPNHYRTEALPTITRDLLGRGKELVDTYVDLGCRAIFLRRLDPFGFASTSSVKLGYSVEDFLAFYQETVDYIIELNKQGVQVMERLAAIMFSKMLGGEDPNFLDLRSPGGNVIGQLAYLPTGEIYCSDEGRMMGAMGDDSFSLGHIDNAKYRDVMGSSLSRSLALASTNTSLPGCETCAYNPYCGVCPINNYIVQGSIHGRILSSPWCKRHMGVFDYVARRIRDADEAEMEIFRTWAVNRRLEHFVQGEA